jgi:hypothetical protein
VARCPTVFIVLFCASAAAANAENLAAIEAWNGPCLQRYQEWQQKTPWKAVAVTTPNPMGQGCGFSWESRDKTSAENEALRQCRLRAMQADPEHKDTCRISQVSGGTDFEKRSTDIWRK